MSEYQYFEFQAIDRPLTDSEMRELRRYSSRATITPTSFVNVYNWGDFKGDRRAWLEKYFDAFLYVANWGTHRLEFRLPKRLLDPETVSAYCTEESLACYAKSDFVIVAFDSEDESGEWAEGEGWLASLAPLRTDLMNGDLRCLYLGWLAGVQGNWVCEEGCDKDESEPPVPPGLGALSSPLQSLADFLRIDPDWIAAAAEDSGEAHAMALTHDEIASWVARMPPEKKDAVLMALIDGSDMHSATELRQRAVREIRNARSTDSSGRLKRNGRSIDDLAARADAIAQERQAREAKIRARAKAKREREAAEARKKHIESLVGKEDSLWPKVRRLIATRQPKRYDEAVSLLEDLRDLAAMGQQDVVFASRMEALCREHARKPTFLERLRKANLMRASSPQGDEPSGKLEG